jgi:predicted phage terminase large subunit-like protein
MGGFIFACMKHSQVKHSRRGAAPRKEREEVVFGPCSEKQRLILQEDSSAIVLCGGGAGGGKSRTCLIKALKFVQNPAARVLIVRQSFPMLKLPGGLIDESKQIYPYFKAEFNIQDTRWVFPNGAEIKFSALPSDVQEWQGLQASHILVDEAAEFSAEDIIFLLSRLRCNGYTGHKSLTMTCNPSRASFLFDWVAYSLDEVTGVPLPGTEFRQRWMIRLNGVFYWADSREELWEKCGKPNGLVDSGANPTFLPTTFKFIPLTIYDNPILLRNNPEYLSNLLSQSRVNQLRYLHGSWTAQPDGVGYFRRDWVREVDYPPANPVARVRAWDLAATEKSEVNPDPDWTVGVKISRDREGVYYIEDVTRFRALADGVIRTVAQTALSDGIEECQVVIPRDPGAAGLAAHQFHVSRLVDYGISPRSVPVTGHSSKLSRFKPFCAMAEAGLIRVVKGEWNEAWYAELETFVGNRVGHDDQVDATADACNTLSRQLQLPDVVIPSMTGAIAIPVVR